MLSQQKMNGINLFVYPYASLMLVSSHTPEAENIVGLINVSISKGDQFLLEVFHAFVRISLGELSYEIKSIRFKPLLEFFKSNGPVTAGFTALLNLLNNLTFFAALGNSFPLV